MNGTHPQHPSTPNRRDLLGAGLAGAATLGALGGAGGCAAPAPASDARRSLLRRGDTVLFQGDSITDAGRARDDGRANAQPALGGGYAWLAAAGLLTARPDDDLAVFNRGVSGNKVFQLAARWEPDALALRPDVLSVLIGVNDIWHGRNGSYDGTVEVYRRDYDALLARTRDALPEVRLVVCEPFVLRCGAVDDSWFPAFDGYRAAAREVATAHGATFVAFQAMFDEAVALAPPEHWAGDGVHPTAAGAALMAQTWLRAAGV